MLPRDRTDPPAASPEVILMPGGTGMLAGAARTWALQGRRVILLSRSRRRYDDLAARLGPAQARLQWEPGDYNDPVHWPEAVARACRDAAPDTVVAWIGNEAALEALADVVAQCRRDRWRLFHVRGSRAAHETSRPHLPASCDYRMVILGFVWDGKQARWLTHDEIAGGVVMAVAADEKRCIIGTVEPWDRRPAF